MFLVLSCFPSSHILGAVMHCSQASIGADSFTNVRSSSDVAVSPSRVAARLSRRDDVDDGVGSDADQRLLADLRCVANRRRVFLFEGDAVMLRQLCAEHGMDPQSSDDVRCCFH
ncbi:hypothetical protein OG21DRAFT_803048 [Imleria badia]|nr:hypothetical protein OG21DRAFT_803048 [Imleria badia]